MKAIIFFFLCTFLTIPTVLGQIKIGDNPQTIDGASVLELESSSRVLVITRVNTEQMDAITPQRGGMVYNTDTACIHYYDGAQWINLCDAVSFTITNDPIINNRSTIEITQSEGGYNLEIAKNSILGDNIVDGGIGPDDIQDNSIGQEKLAAESVGSSEIRQNAVGSEEIRDGSIVPTDLANFIPSQVLTTDENGIVQWEDAGNLQGAIGDEVTITGAGTPESPLTLTDNIQLNITDNTVSIADHILDDEDTDATNELVDLSFDKTTNTLTISQSATPIGGSVDLEALVGSDDQILTLTDDLRLQIEDGNEINLSVLNNSGTDEQTIETDDTPGNISISNGNAIAINVNDADSNPNNEIQNIAEVLADGNNAAGLLIKNIGNPVDDEDAVTKAYVDGAITGVGGTIVSTQPNNDIFNNAGAFYEDPDKDATNELQDIAYDPANYRLTLTNPATSGSGVLLTNLIAEGDETIINEGANIIVTGNGTTATPYVITAADAVGDGSETQLDEGANIMITGIGTDAEPYIINAADDQNAAEVTYDNTTSGLVAATTQAAIDELAALPAGSDSQNLTNVLNQGNNAGSSPIIGLNISTDPTSAATRGYVDNEIAGLPAGSDNQTAAEVPVTATPVNYTPTAANVEGHLEGIDAALTGTGSQDLASVLVNGTSAGDNQINNLADPIAPQDAATRNYVEARIATIQGAGGVDGVVNNIIPSATGFVVTGFNGGFSGSVDLDGLFAMDSEVAAAITASEAADGDRSATNEIQPLTSSDGSVGITADGIGFDISVAGSTDDQNLESAILTGSDLAINIEGGNDVTADLGGLATDLEVAAAITISEAADGDRSATNEIQPLTSSDGSVGITADGIGFDISVVGGTDDQNIQGSGLTGETLTIGIEGGNPQDVSLANFALDTDVVALVAASDALDGDTSDTNEIQTITSTDNSVTITPNSGDFDLSVVGGTDDQNIQGSLLTGDLLTIGIEGGNSQDISLADFALDTDVVALIAASDATDGDTSDTNEIQPIVSTDGSVGIAANGIGFDLSVAGGGTDDQNIQGSGLAGETLTIGIEGGNSQDISLADFALDTDVVALIAASDATDGDTSDTNEIQPIVSTDGSVGIAANGIGFDLSVTSGQNITNANLNLDANRTVGLEGNNLVFEGTGNIGMGNFGGPGLPNSPEDKLDVNGQIRSRDGFAASPGTAGLPSYGFYTNNDNDTGMYRAGNNQIGFSTGGTDALLIDQNQNITIPNGSVTVGAALVHPDFVFQKYFLGYSSSNSGYKFASLETLEGFLKANHHLPGIKSAKQVKEEGVWNLSESNIKNLEKIEELFLHTIEQEKKIKALKSANNTLSNEMETLRMQLEEIKKLIAAKTKE